MLPKLWCEHYGGFWVSVWGPIPIEGQTLSFL